jgi:hypothetical protein
VTGGEVLTPKAVVAEGWADRDESFLSTIGLLWDRVLTRLCRRLLELVREIAQNAIGRLGSLVSARSASRQDVAARGGLGVCDAIRRRIKRINPFTTLGVT